MGALHGLVGRVRANPWMAVAVAGGVLLVAAWLAWAIYVASDRGVNEGLGVLIAWPAILAALALVTLPFIGGYALVKRLSTSGGGGDGANSSAGIEAAGNDSEEGEESEPETAAS